MIRKELHIILSVGYAIMQSQWNDVNIQLLVKLSCIILWMVIYHLMEEYLQKYIRYQTQYSFIMRYVFLIVLICQMSNVLVRLNSYSAQFVVILEFLFLSVFGYMEIFYKDLKGLYDAIFVFIAIPMTMHLTILVGFDQFALAPIFDFGPMNLLYFVSLLCHDAQSDQIASDNDNGRISIYNILLHQDSLRCIYSIFTYILSHIISEAYYKQSILPLFPFFPLFNFQINTTKNFREKQFEKAFQNSQHLYLFFIFTNLTQYIFS